jgi:hypothetical protein
MSRIRDTLVDGIATVVAYTLIGLSFAAAPIFWLMAKLGLLRK